MINAALIIEGGAMRSLYTSGVLDIMMENNLNFKYVSAVSAGALNAANYITNQKGRSARINIMHSNDHKYYGLRQFLFSGNIFNFEYLYSIPINELYPYDFERYLNSKQRFIVTATNCETGKPVYFETNTYEEMTKTLTASSSIPLVTKIINVDGIPCLDGGISDPIGFHKAFEDGYEKIIIVLTREINYRKKQHHPLLKFAYKTVYRKYPNLVEKLNQVTTNYNKLIDEIQELEKLGKIFVIRPQKPLKIKYSEKNIRKLLAGYLQGRDEMQEYLFSLKKYLQE